MTEHIKWKIGMNCFRSNCVWLTWKSLLVMALAFSPLLASVAAESKKMPLVAKWGRFEQSFKSSASYSNALQKARLAVVFTSPAGETNSVEGFWDGGKTWKVRFSPDQPGRWTFKTTCSDANNTGLHNQSGEFTCTAASGKSLFEQHGHVRVARDRRHFEHADGTPFLWLADTVWNGARASTPADWETYARTRAGQKFNVAQWIVAPGMDFKKESAFTGKETIAINPEFFQRLDAKIETINRAGLLSAIVPLGATSDADALPEDQAALLLRYVIARWQGDDIAWIVQCEGDSVAKNINRWRRLGQKVFGNQAHAPVIFFPGQNDWLFDEFRKEAWVDAFGYQNLDLGDVALKYLFAGPASAEWKNEPAHPVICLAPPAENSAGPQASQRVSADEIRRSLWWALLNEPTAGVTYAAEGVMNWDTAADTTAAGADALPAWHKSLFLQGAKQMAHVEKFFGGLEFWRLRPAPKFIAMQPGGLQPKRFIAAAGTDEKDISLVYVPEDRTLEIFMTALPPSPSVTWFNPRTGENSPAVAVVSEPKCQFPTPDPGDWVLVMKAGK
jgi:hypothetical protein